MLSDKLTDVHSFVVTQWPLLNEVGRWHSIGARKEWKKLKYISNQKLSLKIFLDVGSKE